MVPFSPLSMPYRVQVQARTGTTPRVKSKSNDRVQRTELRRMSSIKTQFNGALDVVTRWIRESSIDHGAASIYKDCRHGVGPFNAAPILSSDNQEESQADQL